MANILLAEDDESMCQFLTMALEKSGHLVTFAHDGLAAYALLEQHPNKFDLLLTDIVMPGMDGIELSQKASALFPNLKVMFITGFAAVAIDHEHIEEKEAKVLSKPFHLNDLIEQVETILSQDSQKA